MIQFKVYGLLLALSILLWLWLEILPHPSIEENHSSKIDMTAIWSGPLSNAQDKNVVKS